jgi:hypothetical protein
MRHEAIHTAMASSCNSRPPESECQQRSAAHATAEMTAFAGSGPSRIIRHVDGRCIEVLYCTALDASHAPAIAPCAPHPALLPLAAGERTTGSCLRAHDWHLGDTLGKSIWHSATNRGGQAVSMWWGSELEQFQPEFAVTSGGCGKSLPGMDAATPASHANTVNKCQC